MPNEDVFDRLARTRDRLEITRARGMMLDRFWAGALVLIGAVLAWSWL